MDYRAEDLKEREIEIIQLMADGSSNQQIADKLYITLNTVRWYNKQIYSKFGVNSRIKVVNLAREWGVLDNTPKFKTSPLVNSMHNLPVQINLFIGRKDDFVQVQRLLTSKRLLTLTGTAGIGKTRFAVELAKRVLDDYEDGVCFVSLASLNDSALMPKSVATHLKLSENPKQSPVETVTAHLANQNLLLILDNFEHVMDAAEFVQTWLMACPDITILITSREILHWQGEQVYQLQPLAEPNLSLTNTEELKQNEAVTLFLERARSSQSNWASTSTDIHIVGQICAYLEGLPLAIELAAARSNIFSPHAMLEQLTQRLRFLVSGPYDLPERQRSLRNALAWSFDLLNDTEKLLFIRLGIFKGGFSLESIEKICLEHLKISVVEGIASLLHKSLLDVYEDVNTEPRFYMLETMREYAYEKLAESDEFNDMQKHHAEYYLDLAERAYQERNTQRQRYWLNHANTEIDNLRSSFAYLYQSNHAEQGLRILSGLYWFFMRSGYLVEAVDWYGKFLALDSIVPSATKAHALLFYGHMTRRMGKVEEACSLHQSALSFARDSQDDRLIGMALGFLAVYDNLVLEEGQTAFDLAYEARQHFNQVNDIDLLSWIENTLGELYRGQKNYPQAIEHYQISLEIAEEMQDANRMATALQNLSAVAVGQKDFSWAIDLFARTLEHALDAQNPYNIVGVLVCMANLEAETDFFEESAHILEFIENICHQYGFTVDRSSLPLFKRTLELVQANLSTDSLEQLTQPNHTISFIEIADYCREAIQHMQNHRQS